MIGKQGANYQLPPARSDWKAEQMELFWQPEHDTSVTQEYDLSEKGYILNE
jgi:hypothetical protein